MEEDLENLANLICDLTRENEPSKAWEYERAIYNGKHKEIAKALNKAIDINDMLVDDVRKLLYKIIDDINYMNFDNAVKRCETLIEDLDEYKIKGE